MKIDSMQLALFLLILTSVISPIAVNADVKTVININSASTITTNKHQAPLNEKGSSFDKSSSADDSRGLSAFFILGIVINVIMALTFGWWFSKEWRKSKVKGDDK